MTVNKQTGQGLYPPELWDEPFRGLPDEKPLRALLDCDFADPSKWGIEPPCRRDRGRVQSAADVQGHVTEGPGVENHR